MYCERQGYGGVSILFYRNGKSGSRSFGPFNINHSREFARLNVEAQRGFPNFVSPPYLTWHFSVWPDLHEHPADAEHEADGNALRDKWNKDHNAFIKRIVGTLADKRTKDFQSQDEHAQDTLRGNVLTFEGLSFNSALLFRVEFHEEHVSYSFVLPVCNPWLDEADCDVKPLDDDALHPGSPAILGRPHTTTDPNVNALIRDVWRDTVRQDEDEDAFRARAAQCWDRLYDEAWDVAFKEAPSELLLQTNEDKTFTPGGPPGRVFCNTRGLVFPRDWLVNAYGHDEVKAHNARRSDGKEQFIPTDLTGLPTVMEEEELRDRMGFAGHEFMGEEPPQTPRRWNRVSAGRTLVRNPALRHALHWCGGKAPEKLREQPHFHRRTIANLVIDGRAMVASAFASALDSSFIPEEDSIYADPTKTAVRFCVFYCGEDDKGAQELLERRLDRLLIRLNSLATLRLIALKNLNGLMIVDNRLNDIEKEIVEAGTKPAKSGKKQQKKIVDLYASLANLKHLCTGSVAYRTEQSQMYSTQFKRLIESQYPDPIAHRIEGWEPYEEFVSRRLYNQFDNIQRIGERIEYVRERLDRIIELTNLDRTVKLTRLAVIGTFASIFVAAIAFGFTVIVFLQETGIASRLGWPSWSSSAVEAAPLKEVQSSVDDHDLVHPSPHREDL